MTRRRPARGVPLLLVAVLALLAAAFALLREDEGRGRPTPVVVDGRTDPSAGRPPPIAPAAASRPAPDPVDPVTDPGSPETPAVRPRDGTTVRVVDDQGRPVPGARVLAGSAALVAPRSLGRPPARGEMRPAALHEAETGDDGTCRLPAWPGGEAVAVAVHGAASSSLWLARDVPLDGGVRVLTLHERAWLRGEVRARDGRPVAGADVTLWPDRRPGRAVPRQPFPVRTDDLGQFEVPLDAPFDGLVVAMLDEREVERGIELEPGGVLFVALELPETE